MWKIGWVTSSLLVPQLILSWSFSLWFSSKENKNTIVQCEISIALTWYSAVSPSTTATITWQCNDSISTISKQIHITLCLYLLLHTYMSKQEMWRDRVCGLHATKSSDAAPVAFRHFYTDGLQPVKQHFNTGGNLRLVCALHFLDCTVDPPDQCFIPSRVKTTWIRLLKVGPNLSCCWG